MNQILLEPTDVLFFRDGRPMEGSLTGQTAAWPLPDIVNHALLAALHRAAIPGVHEHRRGRSGLYSNEENHRDRKFGSLQTVGPFPVDTRDQRQTWFFARPLDAQIAKSTTVNLLPIDAGDISPEPGTGSLPDPLKYAVGNVKPPSKDRVEAWWSEGAWNDYLGTDPREGVVFTEKEAFRADAAFADREQQTGIAIDSATGTTGQGEAEGKIYSAHYLRLQPNIRLGLFAAAHDKVGGDPGNKRDLIEKMLSGNPTAIVVGGQQRICTAKREHAQNRLPLPLGLIDSFHKLPNGKFAVKWILLSPAIFPAIGVSEKNDIAHPGGWMPTWIRESDGQVMLKCPIKSARGDEGGKLEERFKWRKRVAELVDSISARLVSAIIPKPIPVTGWALPNDTDRKQGGAKSTHFAVPAGAVYYFEAENEEAARSLAIALNWHGDTPGKDIRNRRSSLMGEKGFGLGVCGTWSFLTGRSSTSQ